MGRSRGGLTTKIHAVADTDGLPVTLELSAGQVHDSKPAMQMLKGVQEGCIILTAIKLAATRLWIRGYESAL